MLKQLFFCLCVSVLINKTVSFEAIFERADCKHIDTSIINMTMKFFRYNRTNYAVSGELDLFIDLPVEAGVVIKVYGRYSNKYIELPLELKRTLCDFYKNEFQWIKDDLKGKLADSCPVKKGHYFLENYIPKMTNFPAKPWETNDYMVDVKINIKKRNLVWYLVYIHTSTTDEIQMG